MPKKLLLCDLHTHTTWSDGKLSVPEIVDFYGQRGFDTLCITDHLCDPNRLLGKLVNLTGLVIPPDEIGMYFEEIEREKKRAWAKYNLMLMTGIEFNKDGYTAKTSAHLLGIVSGSRSIRRWRSRTRLRRFTRRADLPWLRIRMR